MQALEITLTGEIQSSNFNDWKSDLLAEIKTIGTELTTDSDFSAASGHVKQLKKAEKALKAAKQSALDQAADIQQLFKAIDEVREQARQTRLTLERQIRARKQEIKANVAAEGIATIKAFLSEQSEDFQAIDHDDFLDEDQYTEALKGKSSLKASKKAIDKLCENIKTSINEKTEMVSRNAAALSAMPAAEQALFQDRAELLAMDAAALNTLIDERLTVFRERTGSTEGTEAKSVAADKPVTDLDLDFDMQSIAEDDESVAQFEIVISVQASKAEAKRIFVDLQSQLSGVDTVKSVVLNQVS